MTDVLNDQPCIHKAFFYTRLSKTWQWFYGVFVSSVTGKLGNFLNLKVGFPELQNVHVLFILENMFFLCHQRHPTVFKVGGVWGCSPWKMSIFQMHVPVFWCIVGNQ